MAQIPYSYFASKSWVLPVFVPPNNSVFRVSNGALPKNGWYNQKSYGYVITVAIYTSISGSLKPPCKWDIAEMGACGFDSANRNLINQYLQLIRYFYCLLLIITSRVKQCYWSDWNGDGKFQENNLRKVLSPAQVKVIRLCCQTHVFWNFVH